MTRAMAHLDRFSAGLDDLSRREQADIAAVLRVLNRTRRFSSFEASENRVIARTMDALIERGYVRTRCLSYPWVAVELTAAGQALIKEST